MKILKQIKVIMLMLIASIVLLLPIRAKAAYNVYTLSMDETKNNSQLIGYDEINLNGNVLTINGDLSPISGICFTGGQVVVTGNVNTANNIILREGCRFNVSGDWIQKANKLHIGWNEGNTLHDGEGVRLTINGKMEIKNSGYVISYCYNGTCPCVLTVKKDMFFSGTKKTECQYLKMNVGGNIIQEEDSGEIQLGRVELQGENQRVILQSNGRLWALTPSSGTLTLGKYMNLGEIRGDIEPVFEGDTLYTTYFVEDFDYTVKINGNLNNKSTIRLGQNSKMVVAGNCSAEDSFFIDGGKLQVNGNMIEMRDLNFCDTGSISVDGNYTQKTGKICFGYEDGSYSGRKSKGSKLVVKKDFYLNGNSKIASCKCIVDCKECTLSVGGNLFYNTTAESSLAGSWYPESFNVKIGKNFIQDKETGSINGGTVWMNTVDSKFDLKNGKVGNLIIYHGKDKYYISDNSYEDLKVICDIKLDANGGLMDAKTLTVMTGDKFGELPTPTRQGYDFDGWYTNNIAGDLVGAGTVSTFLADTTLWAHWKAKDNTQIRAFVNRLYQILLDRDAEQQGLDDWTNRLASGSANAAQIVEGIVNSQEFANKNLSNADIVERMYQSMLGRPSDPDGKAGWTNKLDCGLSANSIINGFSGSAEFGTLCASYSISAGSITLSEPRDQNEGISAFVARCYEKALGRAFEKDGLNYWCTNILNDANKKQKAEEVASNGFFHSQEFANKNTSNDEYVEILYRTFLGREYDDAGKADWVGKLNSGVSRDDVLYGFSRSQEFSNIMSSYGL